MSVEDIDGNVSYRQGLTPEQYRETVLRFRYVELDEHNALYALSTAYVAHMEEVLGKGGSPRKG